MSAEESKNIYLLDINDCLVRIVENTPDGSIFIQRIITRPARRYVMQVYGREVSLEGEKYRYWLTLKKETAIYPLIKCRADVPVVGPLMEY